jgi:hypothetical protein
MADCEFLEKCIFFNDKMAGIPSTSEIFKLRYCQGQNSDCARYLVRMALGKERVPEGLFPNQVDDAREIIARG